MATAKQKVLKPILPNYLYEYRNIPDAIEAYSNDLKEFAKTQNSISAKLHADVLQKYRHIRTSGTVEKNCLPLMNSIYKELEHEDLLFRISGRIKSLISTEEKILKCEENNVSGLQNADKDLIGFRIVIYNHNQDCQESINNCYKALSISVKTLMNAGYMPVLSTGTKDTDGFDPIINSHIYVPEKSDVLDAFRSAVKDYIAFPKNNGYQSLHIIFDKIGSKNTHDSFELQIRTIQMDYWANSGFAKLRKEKEARQELLNVDLTKINMPGFLYIGITDEEKKDIHQDMIGLIDSLKLDHRNRTNSYLK